MGGYKHLGMTPWDYFDQFVEVDYDDYVLDKGNIRLAFHAAISAFHLADHFVNYYHRQNPAVLLSYVTKYDPSKTNTRLYVGEFGEYISKNTNGCFKDIKSISNAYKHLYTGAYATVGSPGALQSISFSGRKSQIKSIEDELTEDGDTSRVVYTRKDGQQIDFPPTLKTVIDFWLGLFSNVDH